MGNGDYTNHQVGDNLNYQVNSTYTASVAAPAMSAAQIKEAKSLAEMFGPREQAIIGHLNINVGTVLDGPIEVIKNVTAIIKKVFTA